MRFEVLAEAATQAPTGCLVVGVFDSKKLSPELAQLDEQSAGLLQRLLKQGDINTTLGQTTLLNGVAGLSSQRLLLVGCGKKKSLNRQGFRKLAQASAKALLATPSEEAIITLHQLPLTDADWAWMLAQLTEALGHASYRFDQLKSATSESKPFRLKRVYFTLPSASENKAMSEALAQAAALNAGIRLSKDLANLPGNICTPGYLAEQAQQLAKQFKSITTDILDEAEMEKLGMGALLSVSRGSRQPAKLIVMEYRGMTGKKTRGKSKPIVLVGKGLTFDAGGISIKPATAMDEMKYDMCGGASVFGTLHAIAEMKLPVHVVGIVPSSENLPDGNANKPGDIVTTMSGQTVEILNTDAEGRLILCDALTYSQRFEPQEVIDIATLTGACVIALGNHACGLLGNDQSLCDALLAAGEESGDRAWQLPLWPEYDEQLKSPFADMANIGGREAGTITAACFLSRYVKDMRWAHLDIAGTAWKSGSDKGATGRPVPLLTRYLIHRSGQ